MIFRYLSNHLTMSARASSAVLTANGSVALYLQAKPWGASGKIFTKWWTCIHATNKMNEFNTHHTIVSGRANLVELNHLIRVAKICNCNYRANENKNEITWNLPFCSDLRHPPTGVLAEVERWYQAHPQGFQWDIWPLNIIRTQKIWEIITEQYKAKWVKMPEQNRLSVPFMSSTTTRAGCEMTTALVSSVFDSSTATFPVKNERGRFDT